LGHIFLCDPDPLEAIRQTGKKIVHCHVENMGKGVHRHLMLWEGDMDLGAYIGALAAAGYEGGLALDLYKCDYLGVAGRSIELLRGLIADAEDAKK
jgi:sugar phosphate isomerase/epimerase